MELNQEIVQLLKSEGCKIIGFADLRALPPEYQEARRGAAYAVVIGEPYGTAAGMRANLAGDCGMFAKESGMASEPLSRYKEVVMELLKSKNYKYDIEYVTTTITYKMLATLSGIGWVGRCSALTTSEWGNAIRLTSVATNAPLVADKPILKSQCPPSCHICADVCHVNAIKRNGILWERPLDGAGIQSDEFFDVNACREGRKQHSPTPRNPFCGKCISACPYTQGRA